MKYFILILSSAIIIFGILSIFWTKRQERKDWNKGICPKCGKPLKNFDMDSQGEDGWCCNDCGYYTWVSYKRYVYKTRNQ